MPARHADATIKVFHKVTLRSDSSLMKNEAPGSLKRCRNQVPVEPSEEEIAIYAYMNFEAEGRPEGRDISHWEQAEEQLARYAHDRLVPFTHVQRSKR
jgi:Protein of unknown function (DUF2934)